MFITRRKFELKLWREDLGDFYIDLLRTAVGDMARFDESLDRYSESDNINLLRKFRTAILVGMALSRDAVFDKRYILARLLGDHFRGYFDRKNMDDLLNGILSSEEGYKHIRRANRYLERNAVWKNPSVHSFQGIKKIKAATLRAACLRHKANPETANYYGKDIEVTW